MSAGLGEAGSVTVALRLGFSSQGSPAVGFSVFWGRPRPPPRSIATSLCPWASTGAVSRWTLLCLSSCGRGCSGMVVSGRGAACMRWWRRRARLRLVTCARRGGSCLGRCVWLRSDRFAVAAQSGDGHGVQRAVEVAVAAAVETVSSALTAAGFERGDASPRGERCLVAHPAAVRPGHRGTFTPGANRPRTPGSGDRRRGSHALERVPVRFGNDSEPTIQPKMPHAASAPP